MSRQDPLDDLGLSLRRGAAEIHVVRHADAVPDVEPGHEGDAAYDAYEGHPLSARGRAQAAATGDRFAEAGLSALYASPTRRAMETAEAIAERTGLRVQEDADVREVALGVLEGEMSLRRRLEALATIAIREGGWSSIPGTEPSAEVRARMLRAVDRIAKRHPGQRVAIVSHAGAINALLGAVAQSPHDFIFPIANASISVVRASAQRRLLMSANETAHLRAFPARLAS